MARTQKNKATSYHVGQLKAKLAKLKRELLTPTSGGGGGAGAGFDVARTGVASIGFIGFPSVGKSTLMSRLTGQHSEVAAYEFTTLTSVPGQVTYNGMSRISYPIGSCGRRGGIRLLGLSYSKGKWICGREGRARCSFCATQCDPWHKSLEGG